jgi:hypothetical protein
LDFFNITRARAASFSVFAAGLGMYIPELYPGFMQSVIRPWYECAHMKKCLVPDGAKTGPCGRSKSKTKYRCHRNGQSALSYLLQQFERTEKQKKHSIMDYTSKISAKFGTVAKTCRRRCNVKLSALSSLADPAKTKTKAKKTDLRTPPQPKPIAVPTTNTSKGKTHPKREKRFGAVEGAIRTLSDYTHHRAAAPILSPISWNKLKAKARLVSQKWGSYRLGDMFTLPYSSCFGHSSHIKQFPCTIAAAYLRCTSKRYNYDILDEVLSQYHLKATPKANDLVVHLRVGDVIEQSHWTAEQAFDAHKRGDKPWKWAKYVATRENIKREISRYKKACKESHAACSHVVLVAGGCHGKDFTKSTQYLELVYAFFLKHGFTVAIRFGETPDDDFAFMSRAIFFVPVHGSGFSRTIAHLGKLRRSENKRNRDDRRCESRVQFQGNCSTQLPAWYATVEAKTAQCQSCSIRLRRVQSKKRKDTGTDTAEVQVQRQRTEAACASLQLQELKEKHGHK